MARELKSIDMRDNPELLRIVEEVRATNEPRVLQREHVDLAILRPVKRPKRKRMPKGRSTSADDALWRLVGIGESEGPGDIARNKHKYLADAYADLHK